MLDTNKVRTANKFSYIHYIYFLHIFYIYFAFKGTSGEGMSFYDC